jgi:3-deoxy-7-phosphoheptulonate synthase
MPVGFKNATDGNVQVAIDGIRSAHDPHHFLSVTKQGVAAIVSTAGNQDCHVILRGGGGPNYDSESISRVTSALEGASLPARIMIDCSHGNSGKDHARQPLVAEDLARQVSGGSGAIFGVMLESFLEDGRQDYTAGPELVRGRSITDACMGWERTEPLFDLLGGAVRQRRQAGG